MLPANLDVTDVLQSESVHLKGTIKNSKLVVVHSREFDVSGETGVGLLVFEQQVPTLGYSGYSPGRPSSMTHARG